MPRRAVVLQSRRGQAAVGVLVIAIVVLVVAVSATAAAALTALVLGFAAVCVAWWRLDCVPRRAVDLVLVLTILVLPVAPALNTVAGVGTPLRLGLAVLLFALIVAGRGPLARPVLSNGRWLVVVFALYQLVALVVAPAGSGTGVYGAVRLVNWVMFLPIVFIAWDARRLRIVMAACFSGGILLVLGIVLQYLGVLGGTWGGQLLPGLAGAAPSYSLRYTSFMQNPNDLGLAMVCLTVAALLVSATPGGGLAWRAAFVGDACLMAAGLILCGSRGALLTLPLVSLYLLAVRRPWAILQLVAVVGLVTIAFTVPSAVTSPSAVASRTSQVFGPELGPSVAVNMGSVVQIATGEDASAQDRLAGWAVRIGHAGNLVIGAGYGGYADVSTLDATQSAQRSALYVSTTVDNGWLKLVLEEGIVGLALLVGILALAMSRAVRFGWRRSTWLLGAIGGSVLTAMAFRALTVDILDINPWNFFIWLVVGILLSEQARASDRLPSLPAWLSKWRSGRRRASPA